MTAPFLLALALVAGTATQLRVGESPIGPGELLLLGWICYAALRPTLQTGPLTIRAPQFRPVAIFWLFAWVLLVAGGILGYRAGLLTTAKAGHDILALGFVTLFCLIVVIQNGMRAPEKMARVLVLMAGLAAFVLLCLATVTQNVGPVSLWFGDRLTGWSENPNQLAQLVIPTPFIAIFLAVRAPTTGQQLVLFTSLVTIIILGIMIGSDGVVVAWLAGLAAGGFVALKNMFLRNRADIATTMLFRTLVPTLVLGGLVVLAGAFSGEAGRLFNATIQQGGQGVVRLVLWFNGIAAISQSPIIGFGPGAHSGFLGPFEGKETHNSIIDWGTSTGLVGIIVLVVLLLTLFNKVWRSKSPALTAGFVALMTFMQLHYALRQPLFWFWILLITGLGFGLTAPQRKLSAPSPENGQPQET
jgi:O-antigen ligase